MIEFRAASIDWMDRVSIIACQSDHSSGKIAMVASPMEFTMKPHDPGHFIQQGTLELDAQAATSLMNALWSAGIRPSDFRSPSGEINRMQAHLEDMRRLVFKESLPQGDGK